MPWHAVGTRYMCLKEMMGLLRGLSGKGSTGHGSDPKSEKIPHAAGQLNPWVTTIEWALQSTGAMTTEPRAAATDPVCPGARPTARGAAAVRSPHTARGYPSPATTRERPTQQQRPNTARNK